MSPRNLAIGFSVLGVLVVGWVVWAVMGGGDGASGNDGEAAQSVLCSNPKCGYSDELPLSKLAAPSGDKPPARMPADGPGYKCPKCGEHTLYAGAIQCPQCGTKYLMSRDSSGRRVSRCPKCEAAP